MKKRILTVLAFSILSGAAVASPLESKFLISGKGASHATIAKLQDKAYKLNNKIGKRLKSDAWTVYKPIKISYFGSTWDKKQIKTIGIKSSTSDAFLYVEQGDEPESQRLTLQGLSADGTCRVHVDDKVYGSPMSSGEIVGKSQSISWDLIEYKVKQGFNKDTYLLPDEEYQRYGMDRLNEGRKMIANCSDGSVHTFDLKGFKEQYQRNIYDYSKA